MRRTYEEIGVLSIALTLHNVATGLIKVNAEEVHRKRTWLLERLATWQDGSRGGFPAFDMSVKKVCEVALWELDNWVPR